MWFRDRLLEDPRVDPTKFDNIAIQSAVENGRTDIVNRLLEDQRVDPSKNNNIILVHASIRGYPDIVERLLKDPRVNPSDLDYLALNTSHTEIVRKLLLDSRIDFDTLEKSEQFKSLELRHIIRQLLEYDKYQIVSNRMHFVNWLVKTRQSSFYNASEKKKLKIAEWIKRRLI